MSEPTLVMGSRRGKPGRPRKGDLGIFGGQVGHNPGTPAAKPQARSGENDSAQVRVADGPIAPRLLDLRSTAAYLGLSEFTVRELEQGGTLSRIRIPLPNRSELRKLLFDKTELDQLIEAWKDRRSDG